MAFENDIISLDKAEDLASLVAALKTLSTNINGQVNIYKDSSTKINTKEALLTDLTKVYNKAIDKIKAKKNELTAEKTFLDPTDKEAKMLLNAKADLDRAIQQFNMTPTKLDSKLGSIKESIQSGKPSSERLKTVQSAFKHEQVPQKPKTPEQTKARTEEATFEEMITGMETKKNLLENILKKPGATEDNIKEAYKALTALTEDRNKAQEFLNSYKIVNPNGPLFKRVLATYQYFKGKETKTFTALETIENYNEVINTFKKQIQEKSKEWARLHGNQNPVYTAGKDTTPTSHSKVSESSGMPPPPPVPKQDTRRHAIRLDKPISNSDESSGMGMPPPPVPTQSTKPSTQQKPPVPRRPGGSKSGQ